VLRGAPFVSNTGELRIGDDFHLVSRPVRSHLFVTGRMVIGHRVRVGAGAAISCLGSVILEDDVAIGDFAIVLDSDFHAAEDMSARSAPRPIRIGKKARIGHRVVVLPGSSIGPGAVVRAGSIVSGEVAAGTTVEGNPARVRLERDDSAEPTGDAARDVPRLVMRVFGLPGIPDIYAGPAQISQWDSLGALRLIVALEETFGISLAEDQFKSVRSIHDLVGHVEGAGRRAAHATGKEL
jgi:acetyltransferase-like isoleucine patch superfamily enzyme